MTETCKECLCKEVCEDFKRNICQSCKDRHNEYRTNKAGICDFFKPTADVVEVKHGKWDNNGEFYSCSECTNYTGYDYDYCPYCGAKMDGGKKE